VGGEKGPPDRCATQRLDRLSDLTAPVTVSMDRVESSGQAIGRHSYMRLFIWLTWACTPLPSPVLFGLRVVHRLCRNENWKPLEEAVESMSDSSRPSPLTLVSWHATMLAASQAYAPRSPESQIVSLKASIAWQASPASIITQQALSFFGWRCVRTVKLCRPVHERFVRDRETARKSWKLQDHGRRLLNLHISLHRSVLSRMPVRGVGALEDCVNCFPWSFFPHMMAFHASSLVITSSPMAVVTCASSRGHSQNSERWNVMSKSSCISASMIRRPQDDCLAKHFCAVVLLYYIQTIGGPP